MDSNVDQPLTGDVTETFTDTQELLCPWRCFLKLFLDTTTRTKKCGSIALLVAMVLGVASTLVGLRAATDVAGAMDYNDPEAMMSSLETVTSELKATSTMRIFLSLLCMSFWLVSLLFLTTGIYGMAKILEGIESRQPRD